MIRHYVKSAFVPADPPRSRLLNAFAMGVLLAAGIAWRAPTLHISEFLSKYGGDALWAAFVFTGVVWFFPRLSTAAAVAIALGFSLFIELSQLYHAPWLDAVRKTRVGALALGATFNPPDLIAYGVGVVCGAIIDGILRRFSVR